MADQHQKHVPVHVVEAWSYLRLPEPPRIIDYWKKGIAVEC
jgi:hypothetical protein